MKFLFKFLIYLLKITRVIFWAKNAHGLFCVTFWAKNARKLGLKWVENGQGDFAKNNKKNLCSCKLSDFFKNLSPIW